MNKGKRFDSIQTAEHLRERCVMDEDDGHWVWKLGTSNGNPRTYWIHPVTGDQVIGPTRRAAYVLFHGRDPKPGHHVFKTCNHPMCVNPEHLAEGTKKDEGAVARKGKFYVGSAKRIASCLRSSRARSELTMDQVAYIRSSDKTGEELAAELRVGRNVISNVRIGKTFRDEAANGSSVFSWRPAA